MEIVLGSSVRRQLDIIQDGESFENQLNFYKMNKKNYAIIPDPINNRMNVIYRPSVNHRQMIESYGQAFIAAMISSGQSVIHPLEFNKLFNTKFE